MASTEWTSSRASTVLSGLFNNEALSDLTLVALDSKGNTTEFYVKRSVMVQASEYWQALLTWPHEGGDGRRRVEIKQVEGEVLGAVLGAIYGRPVGEDVRTLIGIIMAADRFQMSWLCTEATARFVSLAPAFKSDHQELLLQIFKGACPEYDPQIEGEPKTPTCEQKLNENGVEIPQSEGEGGDGQPPRKRARTEEEEVVVQPAEKPPVQPIEPLVVMETTIQTYCTTTIIKSNTEIFADENLLARFDLSMVRAIAVSDELPIKEFELFRGLVRWCKATQTPFPLVETFVRYPFMSPIELKEVREAGVVSHDILPIAYECMLLQDVPHDVNLPYLAERGKNTFVNTDLWMQPREQITLHLKAPEDCHNVPPTWRGIEDFEWGGHMWRAVAMPADLHPAGMKRRFPKGTETKRKMRRLENGEMVPVVEGEGMGQVVEVDDNRLLTLSTYWLGPKESAEGRQGAELERTGSGIPAKNRGKDGWEDSTVTYCRRMRIVHPGQGRDYEVTSPKWRTTVRGVDGALTWYLAPMTQMAQYVKDGKFEIRLGMCSRGALNPPVWNFRWIAFSLSRCSGATG